MADLVLWNRAFFGVKPEIIIKGGFAALAMMGDSNASIPTPEPTMYRPMFGSLGKAAAKTSAIFTSKVASENLASKLGINKEVIAVKNTRNIGKKDMKLNDFIGDIQIDSETYDVRINGELIESNCVNSVPMAKKYFMF